MAGPDPSPDHSIASLDDAYLRMCAARRDLLCALARVEAEDPIDVGDAEGVGGTEDAPTDEASFDERWIDHGFRDLASFVCARYGISLWKASRWVDAARALRELPETSAALASGVLGIDKVVELTRYATPKTEGRLIRWGAAVSCGRSAGPSISHDDQRARSSSSRSRGGGSSGGGTSPDAASGFTQSSRPQTAWRSSRRSSGEPPGSRLCPASKTRSMPGGPMRSSRSARAGSPEIQIPTGRASSCTRRRRRCARAAPGEL